MRTSCEGRLEGRPTQGLAAGLAATLRGVLLRGVGRKRMKLTRGLYTRTGRLATGRLGGAVCWPIQRAPHIRIKPKAPAPRRPTTSKILVFFVKVVLPSYLAALPCERPQTQFARCGDTHRVLRGFACVPTSSRWVLFPGWVLCRGKVLAFAFACARQGRCLQTPLHTRAG